MEQGCANCIVKSIETDVKNEQGVEDGDVDREDVDGEAITDDAITDEEKENDDEDVVEGLQASVSDSNRKIEEYLPIIKEANIRNIIQEI